MGRLGTNLTLGALALLGWGCGGDSSGPSDLPGATVGDGDSSDLKGDAGGGCASLSVDDCEDSGCVVIGGRLIAAAGDCGDSQPVGCMADMACDTAITHARDERGREWRFTDTCVPKGFAIFYPPGTGDLCE